MNHETMVSMLSAYVDGELTAGDYDLVQHHLEQCDNCSHQIRQFQQIRSHLKEAADYEPSVGTISNVMRVIRSEQDSSVVWLGPERFAKHLVFVLSAIVIAIILVGSAVTEPQSIELTSHTEQLDSLDRGGLYPPSELSKDDVLYAALTK
ncbi:MAG: zf-HC2 domain-containing protein [bacterium]